MRALSPNPTSNYAPLGLVANGKAAVLAWSAPDGLRMITAVPDAGVVVSGTEATFGLVFEGSGAIHGVTFDTLLVALTAQNAGALTVSDVHFRNVTRAMHLGGSTKVSVDSTNTAPLVDPVSRCSDPCVLVDGSAELTVTGGSRLAKHR